MHVQMQELRKKKVKGKDMLHKKAGDNWQTSKYKLAILSLQGTILQIDDLVGKGLTYLTPFVTPYPLFREVVVYGQPPVMSILIHLVISNPCRSPL